MMGAARIGVLARAGDDWARRLVELWGHQRAQLLLPQTPLTEHWSLHLDGHGEVRISAPHGGLQFAAIVARVDRILESDCLHVQEADRGYAATELQAFWMACLHGLACPRLNPPSLRSLCGEALGLPGPAHAAGGGAEGGGDQKHHHVTVVGRRVLDAPDREVSSRARELAQSTRLPMLGLDFIGSARGYRLGAVSVTPSPSPELACEAIDEHLMRCEA